MASYLPRDNRWSARVRMDGEPAIYLGTFSTKEKAEAAEHSFLDTYCGIAFTCRHPYCRSKRDPLEQIRRTVKAQENGLLTEHVALFDIKMILEGTYV